MPLTNDEASPWDEFKDPGVARWKMARAAIEHENILKNHRISWLILSQAFLFAAFAAVFIEGLKRPGLFDEPRMLLFLGSVCIIGLFICLVVAVTIGTANRQIGEIVTWYYDNSKIDASLSSQGHISTPPVNGHLPGAFYYFFSERGLALGIAVLWLVLSLIPLVRLWQLGDPFRQVSFTLTIPLGVLALLVVILLIILFAWGYWLFDVSRRRGRTSTSQGS